MQTEQNKLEEVIKLWKENNYGSATFEFSCGGDSMGDTNWSFYKPEGGLIVNRLVAITDFLEDEVYKRVNFYECSDGHYQGEFGNVEVTLNGEEDDFDFVKSSTSEWSEQFSENLEIELTEVEASFVRENIRNFNGGDGETNVNYSRDFILTEEQEAMLNSISERIEDSAVDLHIQDAEGEEQEWYTYDGEVADMKDNKLIINVTKNYTILRDSED